MSTRTWSPLQQDIFAAVKDSVRDVIVIAGPGSGKTSTIVEASEHVPPSRAVLFLAFNKSIATELKDKINGECMTMHAFGFRMLRSRTKSINVDDQKVTKLLKIAMSQYKLSTIEDDEDLFTPLRKAVSAARTIDARTLDELRTEIDRLDLSWEDEWWPLVEDVCTQALKDTVNIDFDDMLLQPLEYCSFPRCGTVFIDEVQDLNPVQLRMIAQLKAAGALIVAVGDPYQAIYGFRGASTTSFQSLIEILPDALKLPLSISYRCPQSVVRLAQTINPDISPFDLAPEGQTGWILEEELEAHLRGTRFKTKLILSRTNAPALRLCLRLIARQIPCFIVGRDIGDGLKKYLTKASAKKDLPVFDPPNSNEPGLLRRLTAQVAKDLDRLRKKNLKNEVMNLEDKIACVNILISSMHPAARTSDLLALVDRMFAEGKDKIRISSVHRAKGLEAEGVFLINPELIPHPKATLPWELEQENNLHYVAITRAQQSFLYVKSLKEDLNRSNFISIDPASVIQP